MTHHSRPPDLIVKFQLTAPDRFVRSGYRPTYGIRPDYWSSAYHAFIGTNSAKTGEACQAEVWLLTPEAYPHTLWVGRQLDVAEGPHVVGTAEVLQILIPLLEGAAPST